MNNRRDFLHLGATAAMATSVSAGLTVSPTAEAATRYAYDGIMGRGYARVR